MPKPKPRWPRAWPLPLLTAQRSCSTNKYLLHHTARSTMTNPTSLWRCHLSKKMKLESASNSALHERDMTHRWWTLPVGVLLPLSDGERYRLLSPGRPGGSHGPDVRDAVFCSALTLPGEEEHRAGDVEFHVRASEWFAHQHQYDARYNNVILHVVLVLDNPAVALRQDGTSIPTCCLNDLPLTIGAPPRWPCQQESEQVDQGERARLLRHAGLLRFEQKTRAFVELLRAAHAQGSFSSCDACLIVALAEGLGYGRDRAFFRAAGYYLLGMVNGLPEPLGRTFDPPSLDASRLSVLRKLIEQWRTTGAWETMKQAINLSPNRTSVVSNGRFAAKPRTAHLTQLHTIFTGLGTARADILICNIVLPFAMAVALIENDALLAQQAQMLYLEHPGLTSNRVTRAMCQQLQLAGEPQGACQQQGLHYIYQQTCREKRCEVCIVGKRNI